MLNFLVDFADFIVSVVTLVINLISSLLEFISMIPQYANLLISSITFLPSFFLPFCFATISLSVVFFIFNRS